MLVFRVKQISYPFVHEDMLSYYDPVHIYFSFNIVQYFSIDTLNSAFKSRCIRFYVKKNIFYTYVTCDYTQMNSYMRR